MLGSGLHYTGRGYIYWPWTSLYWLWYTPWQGPVWDPSCTTLGTPLHWHHAGPDVDALVYWTQDMAMGSELSHSPDNY